MFSRSSLKLTKSIFISYACEFSIIYHTGTHRGIHTGTHTGAHTQAHSHNYDDEINLKFSTRDAFQMQNVYAEKVKVACLIFNLCREREKERERKRG